MSSTPLSSSAYGSWASPISAELIASSAVKLGELKVRTVRRIPALVDYLYFQQLDEHKNRVYWIEGRASEAGRSVIVGCDSDTPR